MDRSTKETFRVLIVNEDIKEAKDTQEKISRPHYRFLVAKNGREALKLAAEFLPDIIILDNRLPRIDGFEVCHKLKDNKKTNLIPVVLMDEMEAREERVKAFKAGADDFIVKPVDETELQTRINALLRVKSLTDQLETAEHVIYSLATALEIKDPYLRGHSVRVSNMAEELAEAAGVDDQDKIMIKKAGLLHDIGKIGIDNSILHKSSQLTDEELAKVQKHPEKSEEICEPLVFAAPLLRMIRHHHEWWNGQGYPDSLSYESIPIGARILAIVDAYDAMVSKRPHREPMSSDKALATIDEESGTRWDPDLVKLFIKSIEVKRGKELVKEPNI